MPELPSTLSFQEQDKVRVAVAVLDWNIRKDETALRQVLEDHEFLDALDSSNIWALWVGGVTIAPDLAAKALAVWGKKGNPLSGERLDTILTQEITWQHPDLMDLALALGRELGDDVQRDLLYHTTDTLVRHTLDPLKKERGALMALSHLLDQHGQTHWKEEPAKAGSANLLVHAVKIMEIDEHRREDRGYAAHLEQRGRDLMELLISRGIDPEKSVELDDGTVLINALHVAAVDQDDWGGMEVAMKILLDYGVDCGRVLDKDDTLSLSTIRFIEQHPAGVRRRLNQVPRAPIIGTEQDSLRYL